MQYLVYDMCIDSFFRMMLSEEDLTNTNLRYNNRFAEFGYDQKSVGWGKKGRQTERFKILSDVLASHSQVPESVSILDIGAGFGDLYPFLISENWTIQSYVGYEVVSNLAAEGLSQYGNNHNFKMVNKDFLADDRSEVFDFAFMSGCFNFKLLNGDNYNYIESVISKAYRQSSIGVAANFITDVVDYTEDYIFYSSPKTILDIAYSLTKRFIIDHSYFPYEYSIALLKDQSFSRESPIFNDRRLRQ